MKSLKGKFLISNSTLKEKSFSESVIFIIEHNEEGAFGLVVNRPLDSTLHNVLPKLPEQAKKVKIFEGGPVRPEVLFILFSAKEFQEDCEEIIPGVLLGTSLKLLENLLTHNSPYHVYHGYAGWAPGQLEVELESKTWVIADANDKMIFHKNPDVVWREALLYRGGIYSYFARNIKDPFLN